MESGQPKSDQMQKLKAEISFLKKVQKTLNSRELYEQFLVALKSHRDRKLGTKEMLGKVQQLFAGHDDLIEQFKSFLKPKAPKAAPIATAPSITAATESAPPSVPAASVVVSTPTPAEHRSRPSVVNDEPKDFFTHAQRLVQMIKGFYAHRPETYQSFLFLLKQYVGQTVPFDYVAQKVGDLFVDHPDLINAFSTFLPDNRSRILRKLAEEKKRELEQSTRRGKSTKASKRKLSENYEKKLSTAISTRSLRLNDADNLDTPGDRHDRCGPSYLILSDQQVLSKQKLSTGRDQLGWSVLNDRMVCTQSGTEGYKDSVKNPHEEVLFKIEDDQFELDITIGKCLSTIDHLEEMAKTIQAGTFDPETLEKGFFPVVGPLQISAFRAVFRDDVDTALWALRADPLRFMQEWMPKFQSQTDEWIRARYHWRGIWRNSQRKSYMRSLDHRGALFKQQDLKQTNPKWVVAQARKAAFQSVTQGMNPDFHVTMRFPPLPERLTVLDDALNVLSLACSKIFPSTDSDVVVKAVSDLVRHTLTHTKEPLTFYASQAHFVIFHFTHLLMDRLALARKLVDFDSSLFDFSKPECQVEPRADTIWLHPQVKEIELHGLPPVGSLLIPGQQLLSNVAQSTAGKSDNDVMEVDAGGAPDAKPEGSSSDDESSDSVDSGAADATASGGAPSRRLARRGGHAVAFGHVPPALVYDTTDSFLHVPSQAKYSTFSEQLHLLLEGRLDQSDFEDRCMKLLGLQSYPLFSIHNAILQLARQTKVLTSSPELSAVSASVLRTLTTQGAITREALDEQYDVVQRALKGTMRTVKFDFDRRTGDLFVSLHALPGEAAMTSDRDSWIAYFKHFIAEEPMNLHVSARRIYLKRNIRSATRYDKVPPIVVRNDNLEAVIRARDYHLIYVEDSSDVFMKTRADMAPPLQIRGMMASLWEARQLRKHRAESVTAAQRSQRLGKIVHNLAQLNLTQ